MRLDFPTILGISTVSILCIFAVILGFSDNDIESIKITDSSSTNKLENNAKLSVQINPQNLPIAYHGSGVNRHHPQYPPFEHSVYNSHVTALATIQSIETKIFDESINEEKWVYGENAEGFSTLFSKFFYEEITEKEFDEITKQKHLVGVEYLENKVPYRYITLKVDQYIKDETEKFVDTIILKIPADGEGVRKNEKVWYQATSLKYPIGEQAMYMLLNFSILAEKGIVSGEFENVYRGVGKYAIYENNTIQSAYSQKVLESLNGDEQRAIMGNYTLHDPENHYKKMKWVLPIPLDEAIIRADKQANTNHLIINYSIPNFTEFIEKCNAINGTWNYEFQNCVGSNENMMKIFNDTKIWVEHTPIQCGTDPNIDQELSNSTNYIFLLNDDDIYDWFQSNEFKKNDVEIYDQEFRLESGGTCFGCGCLSEHTFLFLIDDSDLQLMLDIGYIITEHDEWPNTR